MVLERLSARFLRERMERALTMNEVVSLVKKEVEERSYTRFTGTQAH